MFEVQGITEWMLYKKHYKKGDDLKQEDADFVAQRTKRMGFNTIVWDAGRSVLLYHSKLKNVSMVQDKAPDKDSPYIKILTDRCQLRYGQMVSKKAGLHFSARLCMNRHYKKGPGSSDFSINNPQLHCIKEDGSMDHGRLCYFFDEVKKERIDILDEMASIEGVECIQLDFCRQPPMLNHHPKMVEAFVKKHGYSPHDIKTPYFMDRLEWYQFRADIMTDFMRQLKAKVNGKAKIEARIPDNAPWLNLYNGFDVVAWCREGLIDKLTLSPLIAYAADPMIYTEYYTTVAHAFGIKCLGGIGSHGLIDPSVQETNHFMLKPDQVKKQYKAGKMSDMEYDRFKKFAAMSREEQHLATYNREDIFALAYRIYMAGVDGVSVYQTDTVLSEERILEDIKKLIDPEQTKEEYAKMGYPPLMRTHITGADWHSTVYTGLKGYDI